MTKSELAWVAGLLEGEGCFRLKKGGTKRAVCITCHMTDPDVLRTLRRRVGVGHFGGPYSNGPRGRLPRYVFLVQGLPALKLMKQLLPWMHSRRAAKIKSLIVGFESVRLRKFAILNLRSGVIHWTRDLKSWRARHGLRSESLLWRTMTGERGHYKGWRRLV